MDDNENTQPAPQEDTAPTEEVAAPEETVVEPAPEPEPTSEPVIDTPAEPGVTYHVERIVNQ